MDLLKNIRQYIEENDMPSALAELEKEASNKNQQDDILSFRQQLNQIRKDNQNGVQTAEQITAREFKLSRDILEFTDLIINDEYEEKTKPNFKTILTQTPSKNARIGIFILTLLLPLFLKFMPQESIDRFKNAIGDNYEIFFWIGYILIIALLAYLTFRKEKPKLIGTENNLLATETDKITQNLIERYESRLIQKTDKRLPVDLKLTYTKEGTSTDYKHWDKGIRVSQKLKENWVATLKKHQHILIIGNPGAGKSTQLLELAVAWLKDETCTQIPVVFNLAPWTTTDKHFHEWLEFALVSGYGFSKALAKEAIANNQILPLLDGLDEVGTKETDEAKKAELRSHCLAAIDTYLKYFDLPYTVICSRINEYTTATDAPIKAEVLINPLTPKQIKQTLTNALKENLHNQDENAAKNLLDLIKNHPTLETVLCTPFYYNAALDVFDGRTETYNLPNEKKDLERYLVEAFLDKKFENTENTLGYTEAKSRHYLGFVAYILYIINLNKIELLEVTFRISLLLFGNRKLITNKKLRLEFPNIISKNRINLKYINDKETWLIATFSMLAISFMAIYGNFLITLITNIFKEKGFPSHGNLNLIYITIVYGLISGLIVGMTESKTQWFSTDKPYQNILRIPNLFSSILFFGIPLFLGYCFWNKSANYFIPIIIIIIFVGVFSIMGSPLITHFKLRFALYQEQKLPLRWVSFFTYATKARILEQDGGQWRFRHQILENYFLEEWKKKN